jgi:flavin-dependent dehydrogenase
MQFDYDVIILGGGMAGLTLAMQIKQKQATISIAILEMRKKDAPLAAHKVGESTVELGTYYLREVLQLKDYLEKNHLHKHGLRFYFSPQVKEIIDKRVEYGARNELFVPSHQIDRGLFENDLVKMVSDLDVEIKLGAKIRDANLSDEGHIVHFEQDGKTNKLTSKWIVDATGRANFLKRKEGLRKDVPHNINAVWFRIEGEIDIEDWSENEAWKNYINPGLRRLGTVHFMGKGYWVWFIPLQSGNTSIGIVADPRFHDFTSLNKLEKAFDWLEKNEPLCAKHLTDKKDKILDFKVLKNFSYNSELFYSTDNWGLVGEAGAFLDPFYSPGADFIALANTWMSDLIVRENKGEDVYTRTIVYENVYAQLFENWLPIYQEKYELFDNAQVMSVKITWDFGVYWAIPSLLFTNEGFINLNILKALFTTQNSFGERFGKLNKQVQDFYLDWGHAENKPFADIYIDPMAVPFIAEFQKGMEFIHESDEKLINKLEENLTVLEKMAAETFRIVSTKLKGTPSDLPVDPYQMSLKLKKEELVTLGNSDSALSLDSEMSNAISSLWLKEKVVL